MRGRAVVVTLVVCTSCAKDPPPLKLREIFRDDFDRAELGDRWKPTASGIYRIEDGRLRVENGYNHPLWLDFELPAEAVIDVDCWSMSPDGDLKVEAWGDGVSYSPAGGEYTSSGYVFVFGGWHNQLSIAAQGNEHTPGIPQRREPKVERGRKYHWRIVRRGDRIEWYIDDMRTPFLTLDDRRPLRGAGHDRFGFNDWQAQLYFDNLVISAIE
jgi:hypothetical protein